MARLAVLLPLALTAHTLRLFGRLDELLEQMDNCFPSRYGTALLPVIFGLAQEWVSGSNCVGAGIWNPTPHSFFQFAGAAGAWILMAISLSAQMAATLSWGEFGWLSAVVSCIWMEARLRLLLGKSGGLDPAKEIVVVELTKSPLRHSRPSPENAGDGSLADVTCLPRDPLASNREEKREKGLGRASPEYALRKWALRSIQEREIHSISQMKTFRRRNCSTPPPPRNTNAVGKLELDRDGREIWSR